MVIGPSASASDGGVPHAARVTARTATPAARSRQRGRMRTTPPSIQHCNRLRHRIVVAGKSGVKSGVLFLSNRLRLGSWVMATLVRLGTFSPSVLLEVARGSGAL